MVGNLSIAELYRGDCRLRCEQEQDRRSDGKEERRGPFLSLENDLWGKTCGDAQCGAIT
jgi:hypothetical protein